MDVYCCTLYNDNAKLIFSYCSVNLHCLPGWVETPANDCTACPTVGDRNELLAKLEQDQPGSSQYAIFEDDPRYPGTSG
jgi:hypothetical protein